METTNLKKGFDFIQPERTHFKHMLAKNPNYFGNIPGSKLKSNMVLNANIGFEQLTCIGYNPDTENMQATISINRSSGYSGDLCAAGSFEYVRFYLDMHDGKGFIDQGLVAINVHDIPQGQDCQGHSNFPLKYVATLVKKTPDDFHCENPVLPTMRAILSWGVDPPADSPNWGPVWGNVMDADIQLKPADTVHLKDYAVNLSKYMAIAVKSPYLTTMQVAKIAGIDYAQLNPQPFPPKASLANQIKKFDKSNVPASRFAFKNVYNMIKFPASEITMMEKTILSEANINVAQLIDKFGVMVPKDTSKANVEYEELECIGLDYNTESLVATLSVKKNNGYSGNLCSAGSKEYISFWIDWDDQCSWQYLNTVELKVYDLQLKSDALSYTASLPLDANTHRKLCENPNIVRVRGVLSWNVPPSSTDPYKLEYYGNRVDAHIQIKPGTVITPEQPSFTIIGGIDVNHVDNATGLTKPGSVFAFNALSVPDGAPFGAEIVVNGPPLLGCKYRFKITNQTNGSWYYLNDPLLTLGSNAIWNVQIPDASHYYDFLPLTHNLLNVLARFTPGTDDKLKVEMEVLGGGTFFKIIQMDNTLPVIKLSVDYSNDCTHYKKGDHITGYYYVYDKYISNWSFGTTWGGAAAGTSNTPPLPGVYFDVNTPDNAYPCGAVSLYARDKTILDSQRWGHEISDYFIVCLQPN